MSKKIGVELLMSAKYLPKPEIFSTDEHAGDEELET